MERGRRGGREQDAEEREGAGREKEATEACVKVTEVCVCVKVADRAWDAGSWKQAGTRPETDDDMLPLETEDE
eukprot:3703402-Rhodomonas_salina.3